MPSSRWPPPARPRRATKFRAASRLSGDRGLATVGECRLIPIRRPGARSPWPPSPAPASWRRSVSRPTRRARRLHRPRAGGHPPDHGRWRRRHAGRWPRAARPTRSTCSSTVNSLTTFDRSTFTAVSVEAGDGDDEVSVRSLGPALENVTIDGGAGNDTLHRRRRRRDAHRRLRQRLRRRQHRRRHRLARRRQRHASSGIPATAPTSSTARPAPTRCSSTAPTSARRSTLSANGAPRAPHAQRRRDQHGPRRHRAASTSRTLGGADTVTVDDLAGTDVDDVDVDLAAIDGDGDAAADTVVVNGTDGADNVDAELDGRPARRRAASRAASRVTGGEADDSVDVATLGGDDTLDADRRLHRAGASPSTAARAPTPPTYNGTAGDDTIGIARNGTAGRRVRPTGAAAQRRRGREPRRQRPRRRRHDRRPERHRHADHADARRRHRRRHAARRRRRRHRCSAAPATTSSTATSAPTPRQRRRRQRHLPVGSGRRQRRRRGRGRHRHAATSTAPTSARRSTLSANGPRVRLTRNVAAITMDLDGVEAANVRTLGSADNVTVDDLAGTDVDARRRRPRRVRRHRRRRGRHA